MLTGKPILSAVHRLVKPISHIYPLLIIVFSPWNVIWQFGVSFPFKYAISKVMHGYWIHSVAVILNSSLQTLKMCLLRAWERLTVSGRALGEHEDKGNEGEREWERKWEWERERKRGHYCSNGFALNGWWRWSPCGGWVLGVLALQPQWNMVWISFSQCICRHEPEHLTSQSIIDLHQTAVTCDFFFHFNTE